MAMAVEKSVHEEEETDADAPVRYLPLTRLYSATSACINPGGGLLSVKVQAREPVVERVAARGGEWERSGKPPVIRVYERRRKRRRVDVGCGVGGGLEPALVSGWGIRGEEVGTGRKGAKLRVLDGVRGQVRDKRDFPRQGKADWVEYIKRKRKSDSPSTKRWVELCFDNVDQNAFVGLYCKVYWPLDDKWYNGSVIGYSQETQKHQIKYDDSDVESLKLFSEKIKFHVSREEMECLNIKISNSKIDKEGAYFDELVALAASFDDCPNLEPGDILWAKLTGHSKWPAIVIGEAHVSACKSLKQLNGERRTIPVQFFGTHDFARIKLKQAIPFLRGLLSSFHTKCKQTRFDRALEEARMYLRERKLPKKMVWVQNGYEVDEGGTDSDDDENVGDMGGSGAGGEGIAENTCPLQFRDLQVLKLGKIVRDSPHFFNKHYIWPEGYTAVRKFISVTDSRKFVIYKMEVLRNPQVKAKPLFRVTMKNGKQIDGSTPTACWKKIYKKLKLRNNLANGIHGRKMTMDGICKSGSFMFGFSIKKIKKLIKGLPGARIYWKSSCNNLVSQGTTNQLSDYRPVHVEWKDLDKCNVCHMDEEYLNNLFLQCDKCRMMVHARCYGEEPMDGVLWLCNLCREGAPSSPPLCCLCPVTGGAMKPTTDGRWAHLTCAMWIPETCLLDVRKMEPIDGIERISKDRWKLLCSICGVSYGACIQCSNNACRIAYHPLCARAAGLCVELADEDIIHFRSVDEDEDHQCIRLFSFCKKHKQPSNDHSIQEEQMVQAARSSSSYTPPSNPSGCARCEPYNHLGRRGLKEPEALVAASVKRAFVENIPYLVSGFRQNRSFGSAFPNELLLSYVSSSCQKVRCPQVDPPESVLSMAEKYKYMKLTFCKRLAFGKSRIHGFGIFAKQSYKAGDMVIEYIGELVRPPVADIREHAIYNSLVGAGTYMFRIDDERVIDATRAGSIAHLINHSCEPNCYSRMITVHGDEHIIIYAKRDINQWEELTYDYRFFSIEEKLPCYCGFPRCRGVVNDFETEERLSKLNVPRSELIEWKED